MNLIKHKIVLVLICLCILAVIIPSVSATTSEQVSEKEIPVYNLETDDNRYYSDSITISKSYDGKVTNKTDNLGIEEDFVRQLFTTDPSMHESIVNAYSDAGKFASVSKDTHIIIIGERLEVVFNEDETLVIATIKEKPTIINYQKDGQRNWEYTPTITYNVDIYNKYTGLKVGRLYIEGYFEYNNVDTPRGYITDTIVAVDAWTTSTSSESVVQYHNEKKCALILDVDAYMYNPSFPTAHKYFQLKLSCDHIGGIYRDYWES